MRGNFDFQDCGVTYQYSSSAAFVLFVSRSMFTEIKYYKQLTSKAPASMDRQPIEDMPSTSIELVPVFRIQNQVKTASSHNTSDKTAPLINSLPEGDEHPSTPVRPLILKRDQAWK